MCCPYALLPVTFVERGYGIGTIVMGNFQTDVTVIGFVALISMRSCDVIPIFLAVAIVVITVT